MADDDPRRLELENEWLWQQLRVQAAGATMSPAVALELVMRWEIHRADVSIRSSSSPNPSIPIPGLDVLMGWAEEILKWAGSGPPKV